MRILSNLLFDEYIVPKLREQFDGGKKKEQVNEAHRMQLL